MPTHTQCTFSSLKGRQAGFEVARRLLEYQPATKIKSLAKELCFQVLWLLRYLTLNAVVFQAKNSNRPIPYVSHKKISLIWLTFNDITQFKPIQNLSSDHKDDVAMNLDSNRREETIGFSTGIERLKTRNSFRLLAVYNRDNKQRSFYA